MERRHTSLLAGLGLAIPAWANIRAGGGSRILGTNFIVELVLVMTSVWVPALLIGTLVAVIAGVSFGYLRMGPGMSKLIFAVLDRGGRDQRPAGDAGDGYGGGADKPVWPPSACADPPAILLCRGPPPLTPRRLALLPPLPPSPLARGATACKALSLMSVEPAFGLVTLRTIKGLPVWIVFLLGGGAVGAGPGAGARALGWPGAEPSSASQGSASSRAGRKMTRSFSRPGGGNAAQAVLPLCP